MQRVCSLCYAECFSGAVVTSALVIEYRTWTRWTQYSLIFCLRSLDRFTGFVHRITMDDQYLQQAWTFVISLIILDLWQLDCRSVWLTTPFWSVAWELSHRFFIKFVYTALSGKCSAGWASTSNLRLQQNANDWFALFPWQPQWWNRNRSWIVAGLKVGFSVTFVAAFSHCLDACAQRVKNWNAECENSYATNVRKLCISTDVQFTVADLEGAEPAPPSLPLLATDWRRHSRYSWYVTTTLYYGDTIANLSLRTRKTWYSEYPKWLPPVTFW